MIARWQTNWNPDDRRGASRHQISTRNFPALTQLDAYRPPIRAAAPHALQKQATLLDNKPEVDLVAGPVRQLTASPLNNTWETTHDNKARLDACVQHAHTIVSVADGGRVAAAA